MINATKGACPIDFEQMVDRLLEDTAPKKVEVHHHCVKKDVVEDQIQYALKRIFRIEEPVFNYAILGKDNRGRTVGTWKMYRYSGYFTSNRTTVTLKSYKNDKDFYLSFEEVLRYQVDRIFIKYHGDLHYNILWQYSDEEFAGSWQYGRYEGFFQARAEIIDQHKKIWVHLSKYDGSEDFLKN